MATVNSSNFSDGLAGQVLTSNGPATNPTFQPVSAAGAVVTIKGNDAVAEVPDGSGVFNFLTANSTVKFAGTANTETLDFVGDANGNLALGDSLAALAGGVNNVAIGSTAGHFLTSGSGNICIGVTAGVNLTTGTSNTFIGGGTATTTGSFNTAVGAGSMPSGSPFTGTYNIAIGVSAGAGWQTTETSNIALGFGSGQIVGESNTLRIGVSSGSGNGQLNRAFICGIDGVNVGSVAKVVTMASNQLGTATITAGTGVSIIPTANVVTVNAVGGGVTWTVETVNLVGAVNHGYIANKAGTLTITLPAASAIGDVIKVTGMNTALGWQIQCGAGQQIFVGAGSTTVAGSITSTAIRDSIEIVCVATNLTWNAVNWVGNLTLA